MASRVQQVRLAHKEQLVQLDPQVRKAIKDHQVLLVQLDLKEPLESMA